MVTQAGDPACCGYVTPDVTPVTLLHHLTGKVTAEADLSRLRAVS
jgi:hypothetical protein